MPTTDLHYKMYDAAYDIAAILYSISLNLFVFGLLPSLMEL